MSGDNGINRSVVRSIPIIRLLVCLAPDGHLWKYVFALYRIEYWTIKAVVGQNVLHLQCRWHTWNGLQLLVLMQRVRSCSNSWSSGQSANTNKTRTEPSTYSLTALTYAESQLLCASTRAPIAVSGTIRSMAWQGEERETPPSEMRVTHRKWRLRPSVWSTGKCPLHRLIWIC